MYFTQCFDFSKFPLVIKSVEFNKIEKTTSSTEVLKRYKMNFKTVFVSVGTTKFDNLIKTITDPDTLRALKERNCSTLKIQYGAGDFSPSSNDEDITVECFRYKDSLHDDISEADLVISHAGAGTCLEVLELEKPLITVINDELMHNHQTELAEKLAEKKHSFCCTCCTLADTINNAEFDKLKPFIYKNDEKCALFVQKLLDNKIS